MGWSGAFRPALTQSNERTKLNQTIPHMSQRIKLCGHVVSITPHAFERAVQRVFGDTTRDVAEHFCGLLEDEARITDKRPDWKAESCAPGDRDTVAWLYFDSAGVVFAMPLALTNGMYYAKTLVTPSFKAGSGRAATKPRRKGRSGSRHKRITNRRDYDSHEYLAGEGGEFGW